MQLLSFFQAASFDKYNKFAWLYKCNSYIYDLRNYAQKSKALKGKALTKPKSKKVEA